MRRSGKVRLKLWCYGFEDLAALYGIDVASVRKACRPRRGRTPALDPRDLSSIVAFATRKRRKTR